MHLTFAEALRLLGPNAAARIANAARPAANYLFATLLPEINKNSYHVDMANMIIRTTMAGLAGMDSPYPVGGQVEIETFLKETGKIANQVQLSERALRELQQILLSHFAAGNASVEFIQNEALNFLDKLVIQAHMDTMEWLRGRALNYGQINWTFNKKNLLVSYGIPAGNFLTTRSGNDRYGGSASKFWTDVKEARRLLRNNLRAVIAHPTTIDEIVYNDVNKVQVLAQDNGSFTIQRLIGTNDRPATDARETIQLVSYDAEGEKLDAETGLTTKIPFQPVGKLLFVGQNQRSGYRVGEGSTDAPRNDLELGYTHIAPTIEGGGLPGRWARMRTPEDQPWTLIGEGVTNGLPVIEAPTKIVVATTDMA